MQIAMSVRMNDGRDKKTDAKEQLRMLFSHRVGHAQNCILALPILPEMLILNFMGCG